MGKFADLEKGRATTDHENSESLRGTEKFGRTMQVVEPPSSGLINVNARPAYIPDSPRPASV